MVVVDVVVTVVVLMMPLGVSQFLRQTFSKMTKHDNIFKLNFAECDEIEPSEQQHHL